MLSCAFFGHRNFDYKPYENIIRNVVTNLIENGVAEFYSGYRGNFDGTCARIVHELQTQYPQIKNIMVLSYHPNEKFEQPEIFDETVYLLEKRVPLKYAISHTNRRLVQTVDYVVSGVVWKWGGAKYACDYAKWSYRSMYNVVTKENEFWDVDEPEEIKRIWEEYEEKLKDEEFRKKEEEKARQIYERTAPQVEANIAKYKNKRRKKKEYHPPVWVTVETKTTEH